MYSNALTDAANMSSSGPSNPTDEERNWVKEVTLRLHNRPWLASVYNLNPDTTLESVLVAFCQSEGVVGSVCVRKGAAILYTHVVVREASEDQLQTFISSSGN